MNRFYCPAAIGDLKNLIYLQSQKCSAQMVKLVDTPA